MKDSKYPRPGFREMTPDLHSLDPHVVSLSKDDEGAKRWFESETMDLIVWYEQTPREGVIDLLGYLKSALSRFGSRSLFLKSHGITGFQLCFNKESDENVFSWTVEDGLSLFNARSMKELPLSRSDTALNELRIEFSQIKSSLPSELADLVMQKLTDVL